MQVPPGQRIRYLDPDPRPEDLAAKLRSTCALADAARALKRAQLRLDHPAMGDDWVEAQLVSWIQSRPGAEHGDGVGRPARWPRG